MIALFVVEMSSKKKRKRSCPFSSAKKAPKRKTAKVFRKEWAEALTASDEGSFFELDKLLELDGLDEEQDEAVPVFSASRLKLEGKYSDHLQETESQESESEESDSQESWEKLNDRTIVSGNCLLENLEKSVSCRFCNADVTLLENVSAKAGVGSSWIVSCCNEHCPLRETNSAFNTTPRGKGFEVNRASVLERTRACGCIKVV